jgi:predicted Zn-dependent protease
VEIRSRNRRFFVLQLVACATLIGCAARQPGDPLRPGFNLFSIEDDIEIGQQGAEQIEMQVEIVEDRDLQDYISRLGQALARHPQAGPFPYRFTLIRDPAINAFALPGGPIYIHSGLVVAAANEAQLAGVMAHEISHAALRHGTSQASRANLVGIAGVLAAGAGGGALAGLGEFGVAFGISSVLLNYSRNAEREADALGARLMSDAGYDPIEMAAFFETLEAEGGARGPEFLSSHPSPGSRVQSVRAEIQTFPAGTYDAGTGRFAAFKRAVEALEDED